MTCAVARSAPTNNTHGRPAVVTSAPQGHGEQEHRDPVAHAQPRCAVPIARRAPRIPTHTVRVTVSARMPSFLHRPRLLSVVATLLLLAGCQASGPASPNAEPGAAGRPHGALRWFDAPLEDRHRSRDRRPVGAAGHPQGGHVLRGSRRAQRHAASRFAPDAARGAGRDPGVGAVAGQLEAGSLTAYNIPLDVAWTDAQGGFHEGGRPDCLAPTGNVGPITFGSVDVSENGASWRQVVWVSCQP